MVSRTLQIVTLVGVLTLGGAIGMAVFAADGNGDGRDEGFFRHLHELGQRLHGGGGHHDAMSGLIEQLELTPDQLQRFGKIHEIVGSYHDGGQASMADLHEELVTQFESGEVGTAEIRRTIDGHLEQIRGLAYAVTDEIVALINELDDAQREILLNHLEQARSADHGHGHGH